MLKEHPDYYERDIDYDHEPVIYAHHLSHICEHFEAVLSQLYGKTPIDMESLERSLDEVANGLGLRLPMSDLNLQQQSYEEDLFAVGGSW